MRLHKRLVWMIVILLSLFSASLVHAQIPDGAEGKSYYTAFPISITVDGEFTDWDGFPRQTVKTGPIVLTSAESPSSLQFAVVADYETLYLLLEVTDPLIVANKHGEEYWFEDSVEVYINATGQLALTSYVTGVAQLNFPAASIGLPIDETIIVGTNSLQVGAKGIVVQTDNGYAIEAAIPLRTNIWNFFPVQDKRLGFQIQLNGASVLDRDMKLSWSNADQIDESYLNPSVFGELIFWKVGDEPARTQVIDQTPTPFVAPIVPTPVPSTQVAAISVPAIGTDEASLLAPNMENGFTVDGANIYDPNGNVFVPKGVNVSGFNWTWTRKTIDDVGLIDQCWNFNLVRVNNWLFKGRVQYPQYEINNNLDEIVNTFTSRGIVVVFEAHDFIGSYYQNEDLDALVSWFTDLATRYANNPYVWFNIMNEPGGRTGIDVVQWVGMHGRVIEAIRGAGADNIIIVEGAFGGQDNRYANSEPVTESAILQYSQDILNYDGNSFSNIVFSIHTWDLWNQGDEKLGDYLDRAREQGLAMIVGEYGVKSDQDTQAAAESTFNTTIPRGVGRVVWHWDGSDYNDLTVSGGGWMINDCQNPTNLTWMGQKIWDDNHTP